jgi:IS605 OrfB family transposase
MTNQSHPTPKSRNMSIKAFRYRLCANKATTEKLQWILDRARELYNAALTERRDAYEMHVKRHPGYYDEKTRKQLTGELTVDYFGQKRELVDVKALRPEYADIASHVLQDVIMRVKRTYDRFFERVKNGQKPGYPRFKGRIRYDSFTYPDHAGWKFTDLGSEGGKKHKGTLHLSKIGTVKVKMHRAMQGTIKTLTLKREGEQWYCIFTCEVEVPALPVTYEDVGIDLGVIHFAALSNGEFIDYPRYFRKAEKKLARAQQALVRKQRGSRRRSRAGKLLTKQHRKVRQQRKDFHHKASRKLVDRYQVIVFEDLQTKNLTTTPKPKQEEQGTYLPNGAAAKAGLNKSILDAGWSTFTGMVVAKAASAGRTVFFVNPSMTSQRCSGCGAVIKKTLADRWHTCDCGTSLDRDINSAKLILNLGYHHLSGGTRPTRETA